MERQCPRRPSCRGSGRDGRFGQHRLAELRAHRHERGAAAVSGESDHLERLRQLALDLIPGEPSGIPGTARPRIAGRSTSSRSIFVAVRP